MQKTIFALLLSLGVLAAPFSVSAQSIVPAPVSVTVTACPSGCQYSSLQAAANHPNNAPVTVAVQGTLTGTNAQLDLGLLTSVHDLAFQCSPGVALDASLAQELIKGNQNIAFSMRDCTLTNVGGYNSFLTNITVRTANFARNTMVGGIVGVTSNASAQFEANTFVNAKLDAGKGETKVFNNTFNNVAGAPNLTALRLSPILAGYETAVYNNSINGYATGMYFKNDKIFKVFNNIIANTDTAFYLHAPDVTVDTNTTLVDNVAVLRAGFGNGQDVNVLSGNPLFMNSSLRIRWQSPAVDRGNPTLFAKFDKAGIKRFESPDIGAYEATSL